jgi:hypothetical protein
VAAVARMSWGDVTMGWKQSAGNFAILDFRLPILDANPKSKI